MSSGSLLSGPHSGLTRGQPEPPGVERVSPETCVEGSLCCGHFSSSVLNSDPVTPMCISVMSSVSRIGKLLPGGREQSTEAEESSWPAGLSCAGHGIPVHAGPACGPQGPPVLATASQCMWASKCMRAQLEACRAPQSWSQRPSARRLTGNSPPGSPVLSQAAPPRLCLRCGPALGPCEPSRPCLAFLCLSCSCSDTWLSLCVLFGWRGHGSLRRPSPDPATSDRRSPVLREDTSARTWPGSLLWTSTWRGSAGFDGTPRCPAPHGQDGPAVRARGGRRRPLALWPCDESVASPEIALRGELSSLSGSSGRCAARGSR